MTASPDTPRTREELDRAEAVYADLVALYPDNEAYLQQYAELLLASNKITTATEALKQLHDLMIRHSPEKAADLARRYPQIGRVDQAPDEGDFQEFGYELRKALGMVWLRLHQKKLIEGQHLYRRGESGDSMYLILSGEVAVYLQAEDGKSTLIDMIGNNDIVGEAAFLSPGPRSADVVANRETTCVELPRKQVLSWLLEHPDMERLLEYKANLRHMTGLISSTALLQGVPLKMRKYMAEQSELIRYPAHSVIHRAGEELTYVDMLVHGKAQLAVRTRPDEERFTPLNDIAIGALIGDTSAVRQASCPADILAISDVLMAHIPLAAFTNVVAAYPPLHEKLLHHAEEERQHIMRQIVALGKGRKG